LPSERIHRFHFVSLFLTRDISWCANAPTSESGPLAAISAPTSLAMEVASCVGIQLYGFCRGEQVVHDTAA
jgi:hypothetical protein